MFMSNEEERSENSDLAPHAQPLRQRTKVYALRIIRLYGALPRTTEAQILGKQLLRSGTSVGANYRVDYRTENMCYAACLWNVRIRVDGNRAGTRNSSGIGI